MHKKLLRLKIGAFVGLAFVLLMGGVAPVARGQSNVWSRAVRISPESVSAWFPDVVVDSTGVSHIVYSGGGSSADSDQYYDTVDYVAMRDGQVVKAAVDVQATATKLEDSAATRPRLLLDKRGKLHLTWRDGSYIFYSSVSVEKASIPTAWEKPLIISSEAGYFNQVLQDNQSRLHLFYTENVYALDCKICFHLYHIQSQDDGATWTAPVDISVQANGSAKPVVHIDADDNMYVIFETGKGGDLGQIFPPSRVSFSASYDGGKTWLPPNTLELGGTSNEARNPTLSMSNNGNLIAAWHGIRDDVIYYQVSTDKGKSWSSPQRIPNTWGAFAVYNNNLDNMSMVRDNTGKVHLIYAGRSAEDQKITSIMHTEWNGAVWNTPEVVHAHPPGTTGDVVQWPQATIGLGNRLNVAWYVRRGELVAELREDFSRPNFEIWYSSATINAKADEPAAIPTLEMTATPAGVPTVTAKPVVAPPAINTAPPSESSGAPWLRTELDDYARLALSLAPVVFLLAFLILFIRRRR